MTNYPSSSSSMGGGGGGSKFGQPFISGTMATWGGDPLRSQWYNNQMTPYSSESPSIIRPFTPLLSADLVESEKDFHVMIDLPGVDKADLDVLVNEGVMTIKAHRREVIKQDIDTYHRTERNFGKVSRTIQIPHNVDLAKG